MGLLSRIARFAALTLAAGVLFAAMAQAQTRVALVIGNGAYQAGGLPRLNNAASDAKLMDETLQGLGFHTILKTNVSKSQMSEAIREFGDALRKAGPNAVGVFYFSGHGVQSGGINYMVPVDAQVQTIEDVESEAPRMGLVLRQMELAGNSNNFVILDACRNNNLPAQSRDAASRGLGVESTQAGGGVFIAYSTRPGAVADDGAGTNSPYTEMLARLMKSEAVPAVNMFIRVGSAVRDATKNRQQPWTENGLRHDDFCFASCGAPQPPVAAGLVRPMAAAPSPAVRSSAPDPVQLAVSAAKKGQPVAEREFKDCGDCPAMIAIPAGSFTMGSPGSEKGRTPGEGPQRPVSSPAFAAGKYEVTLGEFRRFAAETKRAAGGDCVTDVDDGGMWEKATSASWSNPGFPQTGAHPVVCITRDDAKAYAEWLSRKTGETYRLMSEAEWEYAARAGTSTPYSFGDDPNAGCGYVNGPDATAKRKYPKWKTLTCDDGYLNTAPVGSFRPNAFGLYDMHGNVWELVEDCYEDSYAAGQPSDGSAHTKADCDRVVRGGSWYDDPRFLRSAARDRAGETDRDDRVGFRLARTLP